MARNKNKAGRQESASGREGLLGNLNNVPEMVKKYSGNAVKAVNNLSTTQKVIGGALLVLGAGYLTRRAGLVKNLGKLATSAMAMAGRNNKS